VPLSPGLAFVEACLSLHTSAGGLEPVLVESSLPEVGRLFGELPGAFIDSRPVQLRQLLVLLRTQRLAAKQANSACEEAWSARVEAALAPIVDLVLWAYGPCYRRHSRPAVLRGSCMAGWPLALFFCWKRRRRSRASCNGLGVKAVLLKLEEGLSELLDAWEKRRHSRRRDELEPWLDELTFLAYAKQLLSVPQELMPLSARTSSRLGLQLDAVAARCSASTRRRPALSWDGLGEEPFEEEDVLTEKLQKQPSSRRRGSSGVARIYSDSVSWVRFSAVGNSFRWPWTQGAATDDEDAGAEPVSPSVASSQRRGNAVFAAWLLASTLAFAALGFRSRQKVAGR